MAEKAALVRSWRVGKRTVTCTVPQVRAGQVLHAAIEWTPDMPRRLSRRELSMAQTFREENLEERLPLLTVSTRFTSLRLGSSSIRNRRR